MDVKIVVATHKAYWMPEDCMYLPLHVGREGKANLDYAGDDTGDNISSKNSTFCELTGLYWAWKNLSADYLGLAHYRRHFALKARPRDKAAGVLTRAQAQMLLERADIILPKPRNYFIETNYSQYAHAHHAQDLDSTRAILCERWPAYVAAFDECMRQTSGHRFNMFVMRRPLADDYCQWLFDVLFELERRLDISGYSAYDARVFGFVGERLLDVWIRTQKLAYNEAYAVFMEKTNWWLKGAAFLQRKLLPRKNGGRIAPPRL